MAQDKIKVGDTVLVQSGAIKEFAIVKAISARTGGLTVKTADRQTLNVMPYEVTRTSAEMLGV